MNKIELQEEIKRLKLEERQDIINRNTILKLCGIWAILAFPLDAGIYQFLNAFTNSNIPDAIIGIFTISIAVSLMLGSVWYFWTKRVKLFEN